MHTTKTIPFVLGLGLIACSHTKQDVKSPASVAPVAAEPAPAPASAPAQPPADSVSAHVEGCPLPNAFDAVYFGFDSYQLDDSARSLLQQIGDCLLKNPGATITIAGNTDERGTIEYNVALGQERARIAHDYLVRLGVDPAKVKTVSYGKLRPAVNGSGEAAWAKNRRDEVTVEK